MNAAELKEWIEAHMFRMGQSSIRISDGFVIYIDAVRDLDGLPEADYIFVTHDHRDHFNPVLIRTLEGPKTRIVVPAALRQSGKDKGVSTDGIAPGETKTIGDLELTAIPSYNLKSPMHARKKGYVGYLIRLPNGLRVYHAGDTDFVPEMRDLKPDIALLPVGGLVTMNWKIAMEAARAVGATVTIPIHYGILPFSSAGAAQFMAHYDGEAIALD